MQASREVLAVRRSNNKDLLIKGVREGFSQQLKIQKSKSKTKLEFTREEDRTYYYQLRKRQV